MELAANIKKGDYRVANTDKWEPSTWPAEAKGYGYHEAPRGALCHWIVIKDRQIANYQCVVPGGVNASPRDAKGQRGPDEEALIGTPIAKPDQPLEIIRTIHSFDPCMACAIHAVDANGKEIVQVRVR
jgi:[NiFe] hydrogenase large subunit/hydrogenase large subunit